MWTEHFKSYWNSFFLMSHVGWCCTLCWFSSSCRVQYLFYRYFWWQVEYICKVLIFITKFFCQPCNVSDDFLAQVTSSGFDMNCNMKCFLKMPEWASCYCWFMLPIFLFNWAKWTDCWGSSTRSDCPAYEANWSCKTSLTSKTNSLFMGFNGAGKVNLLLSLEESLGPREEESGNNS